MSSPKRLSFRFPVTGMVSAALLSAAVVSEAAPLSYNKDIRPILSDNCFRCHGPDSASRKAGLRLDKFEEATKANKDGITAISPGNPDKSALVSRITTKDADNLMPPPETHK